MTLPAAAAMQSAGGRLPTTFQVAISVLAAAGVFVGTYLHLPGGFVPLLFAVLLATLLPVARTVSARIAIVGALAGGILPLLWWLPLAPSVGAFRVPLVLGAATGVIVLIALRRGWRAVVPVPVVTDLATFGAAAAAVLFFLPALRLTRSQGLDALVLSFGGDNVAHFDMFEMIRRTGAFGGWWPVGANGSEFAYDYYPQHFHVLAAAVAELMQAPTIGNSAAEAQAYFVATAVVLSAAVTVIVAAIASLSALRGRLGFVVVASAAVVSALLVGFGGWSLLLGFPNFLFAIMACVTCVILAMNGDRPSLVRLGAAGAALVAAAHSWSLVAPLAGVAFVLMLVPFWRSRRRIPRTWWSAVIMAAATLAAVAFAALLVAWSTVDVGGLDALSTQGGIVSFPIPIAVALLLLTVATSASLAFGPRVRSIAAAAVPGAVAVTALVMLSALVVLQLRTSDQLGYFQYKFVNAAALIVLVLLPLTITLVIAHWAPGGWNHIRRAVRVVVVVTTSAAILLFFGLPFSAGAGTPSRAPGAVFRSNVAESSAADSPVTAAFSDAAAVMSSWPCDRPIYLADAANSRVLDITQSNMWAMTLSGTWTADSGDLIPILSRSQQSVLDGDLGAVIEELLLDDGRCVVITPRAYEALDVSLTGPESELADRILTWRRK